MSNREEMFALLGIEPTNDKTAIRRAYAKKVETVHPEENPKEWEKVHNAYTELMKSASKTGNSGVKTVKSSYKKSEAVSSGSEIRKLKTASVKEENEEIISKYASKYASDEMQKTIGEIVSGSSNFADERIMLKKFTRILKKVPSTKASFYGKTGIDEQALKELRMQPDFFNALDNDEFRKAFENILEKCSYPATVSDVLIEDFLVDSETEENQNKEKYENLLRILKEKKTEAVVLSTGHKLKGAIYSGGFLSWLFRDRYNLYDYVPHGKNHKINYSTQIYIGKNQKGYRCLMTIDSVPYPVLMIHDTMDSTYRIGGLWTEDYETPDECLEACLKISDYYENRYKRTCVLRFLRQFTILILECLLAASIVMSVVFIPFEKAIPGLLITLGVLLADFFFKLFTVMGYEGISKLT